ncbi:YgaB family protein [Bacillus sp. 2205SS5-2]|uniref:YgaB family protein n=1 Tax=Bacillus sp. 2205SS5-2 TaxID=3109031 RepID=UPI0030070B25
MSAFNQLIEKQLKTMEKLLLLQSEIERYQLAEKELIELGKLVELEQIKRELLEMNKEINVIQAEFNRQTNDVIRTYSEEKATH